MAQTLPDEIVESLRKARMWWLQYLRLTSGALALVILLFMFGKGPMIGEWAYLSLIPIPLLAVHAYLITPWAARATKLQKGSTSSGINALIPTYEAYSFARISSLATAVFAAEVGFGLSGILPILYAAIGVYLFFLLELPTSKRIMAWFAHYGCR